MSIGLLPKKHREVNRVVLLPLSEIRRNPNQPRKCFDQEHLQELSRSIIANGLLQPITVRRIQSGEYELIAGERRTLAFRSLGREHIPAIIEEYTDQQSAVLALIENLQRKDLNYFEEAIGIARLMEHLNLTQHQVSVKLGKAQSTVANKLRLLRYPPEIQKRMLDAGLMERHARALLKLPDSDMLREAVDYIIENRYNVEQTEQYVEGLISRNGEKDRTKVFVIKDMRIFQNSIHRAVDLLRQAGIDAQSKRIEKEDYLEFRIRVPKKPARREEGRASIL